jgi:thioredoxin-like negative regulator of GroEL
LVDALAAGGKLEEADAAVAEALGRFSNNADLISRQKSVRERIAYVTRSETYAFADAALKAFARQDYQTAATEARRAVAADPTNRSYRLILVNSLIAANEIDEANTQIADAIAKVGEDPELLNRQRFIAERILARPREEAFAAADAAYKAFAQKDYVTAAEEARKAIQLDPDNRSYRVLLANIERTARTPVRVMSRGEWLAQNGYSKQRRGDYAGAAADFAGALRVGLPTASQTRSIRLTLADCYLAANDPQSALDVLASFGAAAGYDVVVRRGYTLQALK